MSYDSPYDWIAPHTGVNATYTYTDRHTTKGIQQDNRLQRMSMAQGGGLNRESKWELSNKYANNDRTTQVLQGMYERAPRNIKWDELIDKPNGTLPSRGGLAPNFNPGS
jgi:hypothetical protein